jgi:hypothetical protein
MPLNLLSNYVIKQSGGSRGTFAATLTIFLITFLILFIKVILVHWSYNEIVPTLFNTKYRKITIMEALILVILIQSLFN